MMDRVNIIGDVPSENVFIQMVDDHDLEHIISQKDELERLSGSDWCLLTVKVNSWNRDLTPWEADPIFGNEGFGSGAADTLKFLIDEVIPTFESAHPAPKRKYCITGYSLAGLFALWAGYETDLFTGVVAASPSVWYPGWMEYISKHDMKAEHVYLSLGDKESKTRNQVMAKVGDNISKQCELLKSTDKDCILEWNPGNHFKDPDKRTAKGMAWILKR